MPLDGHMSGRNICVQFYNEAMTRWEDMTGFTTEVSVNSSNRDFSETFVLKADLPVVSTGPRKARTVDFTIVYTQDTTHILGDIFVPIIRNYHESDGNLPFRWSFGGDPDGHYWYTTDLNYTRIVDCPDPVGSGGDSDTVKITFQVVTPSVTADPIIATPPPP